MNPNKSFERDGFVAMPEFYDGNEVKEIEEAMGNFIAKHIPALPPEHVFYEEKANRATLKQIQCLHEHDGFFADLFNDKPRQLAEELLGEAVVCRNLQFFNKPPGIGKATPVHQDGYYFMLEPCHALTMWMALDAADEENGCVRYLAGSHIHGMRPHVRTNILGFSKGISGYDSEADEITCPAQPGDLLAHHALTIHRADANTSATRSRRALGFVFYGESAKEDAPAHEAYQRKLRKELIELGKI
jgi:phytanoyl-CoA hydroxylase